MSLDGDWPLLGRRVRQRREALGLTQDAPGGPSKATWYKVENAIDPPFTRRTLGRVAAALGWTIDSPGRVLAGGEPVVAQGSPERPPGMAHRVYATGVVPDRDSPRRPSVDDRIDALARELAEIKAELALEKQRGWLRREARAAGCPDELSDEEVDVVASWGEAERRAWWVDHSQEQRLEHLRRLRERRQDAATGT